nr:MAG TPA: hypothetical protein [Caudoviricetes sp.]
MYVRSRCKNAKAASQRVSRGDKGDPGIPR